ncbi:MAG: c-type cytochrome [Rhodocyclales bacterium]|nr:c-type cytochrome [Rhodocyclales bacterium]
MIGATVCGALWQSNAMAQVPPGRLLASQCSQCHGTNGQGPGFAGIAGENKYGDLRDMARRRVEGVMDRQARGYTDEQLRLISEYLSTLPQSAGGN